MNEPTKFGRCINCGQDINIGDEYVQTANYDFCDMDCLVESMLEEGNAERKVAGDDTVRIV